MSNAGKLIVASTRLPVTMSRTNDKWETKASAGGLVTALKPVAESRQFEWIGWPGTVVPDDEKAQVTEALRGHGTAPVFIEESDAVGFYEGFSNRTLWPLFHGFTELSQFNGFDWKAYKKVNRLFADEICRRAAPGDLVWVHDYQLALVPELLRQRGIACPVGYFLHIPFPSSEIYRTLPVREAVLEGLLGADFIGFHAYEYVSHFRKSCLRVLGTESEPALIRVGSRRVHLGVLPIGIDPGEVREMTEADEAKAEMTALKAAYQGKKIILGVDRLDYTKGIPEKLLAFEEFLRLYPRWRNKVVLIQVAAPSRASVDEYQALKRRVDELVGRINGSFGTPSHTPIVYINQNVSRTRLTGMYEAADVALVTPVRDGMNLVALEYIAARGTQGGSLILSEFAGAAYLLPGARLVNPYNFRQVAEALAIELDAANTDPTHMLEFVNENTSMEWARRFLAKLEETNQDEIKPAIRLGVAHSPANERLRDAKHPLVLLDYDGTLRAYERKPTDATPTSRIRTALRALAESATVYVVSGRSGDVLEKWLGDLPIGLVCEHGYARRDLGGEWQVREAVDLEGLESVEPLMEEFRRRTPGATLERKRAALAWHYRSADPEFGTLQANALSNELADALQRKPFNVLRGNKVIEVRHLNANKGHAAEELIRRYDNAGVVFCAGDDRTDEDMMDVVRRLREGTAVTCWVGRPNACAEFWTESSDSLLQELVSLAKIWRGARATS